MPVYAIVQSVSVSTLRLWKIPVVIESKRVSFCLFVCWKNKKAIGFSFLGDILCLHTSTIRWYTFWDFTWSKWIYIWPKFNATQNAVNEYFGFTFCRKNPNINHVSSTTTTPKKEFINFAYRRKTIFKFYKLKRTSSTHMLELIPEICHHETMWCNWKVVARSCSVSLCLCLYLCKFILSVQRNGNVPLHLMFPRARIPGVAPVSFNVRSVFLFHMIPLSTYASLFIVLRKRKKTEAKHSITKIEIKQQQQNTSGWAAVQKIWLAKKWVILTVLCHVVALLHECVCVCVFMFVLSKSVSSLLVYEKKNKLKNQRPRK